MKTFIFFTIYLSLVGGACQTVTGYTGGSILIKFKCPENSKEHETHFCKVSNKECTPVTTAQTQLWIPGKRLTMEETQGLISVLIRNLSLNDAGTYRCSAKWCQDVTLNVEHDSCCGQSEEQTAYLGGTVTISCKYPERYESYPKYLFKVQNGSLQSVILTFGDSFRNERFSLNVNSQENIFSVTMTNVDKHDGGIYFCGIDSLLTCSILLTEIQLHVTDYHLSGYILLFVCVCLILLLAGGLSLFLLKQRCNKTKGSISSSNERTTRDCEVSTGAFYEEVKDSDSKSASLNFIPQNSIRLNQIYATADLPTSTSDRDLYSVAQMPKSTRDL